VNPTPRPLEALISVHRPAGMQNVFKKKVVTHSQEGAMWRCLVTPRKLDLASPGIRTH
jgi:hypothetical protein